ncbi:hypothetical protein PtrSN002B_001927 [Pyrenophora tritici-repentis]|nr:hypothetical protein PtrV1_05798 [Pyrenophora tritici-repentis]KAF7450531.1 hypothetical protein A1F99_051470 [Pyrenophora tritici-repentis]KAF7573149.1 hypothetical protein PtrM4_080540 [Pyrenophora tritici-repentis]KAI0584238.1 hypothetical protein Alg215_03199 [Pyrenophora tritici-repentis]KAI0618773.1 hypothetical protein TUN199_09244 [Pyrenophora tritici-repentis]
MILKPELADLVHDVDISFTACMGQRRTPTAQDKKIVKEGLRALATPGWKDWAANCNSKDKGDETVYKAILFYTRNIKSLRIDGDIHASSRSVDWFEVFGNTTAGILSDQAHGFQHLRSVSIENTSASIIQLAPLFRLQSLQTLQIRNTDCWTAGDGHAPRLQRLIPRACNNIESLILYESFYAKRILNILLASSQKLVYFLYDITNDDDAEVPLSRDEASLSLSQALAYQKSSLEGIDVYSEHYSEELYVDVHLRDSLKDFSVLKSITCSLSKVASNNSDTLVQRLPPSLLKFRAYIRQYTYDEDCIEALEHMIANYQSHTPQLQEIIVAASPSLETYNWLKYDWSRLVQLSSKTGLSFKVDRQGDDNDDDFSSNWEGGHSVSSPSSDEVDLYSDDE